MPHFLEQTTSSRSSCGVIRPVVERKGGLKKCNLTVPRHDRTNAVAATW